MSFILFYKIPVSTIKLLQWRFKAFLDVFPFEKLIWKLCRPQNKFCLKNVNNENTHTLLFKIKTVITVNAIYPSDFHAEMRQTKKKKEKVSVVFEIQSSENDKYGIDKQNSLLGYCFTPYQRLWLYNGALLVAFYDTLGIRRTYSRLRPPASSRGSQNIWKSKIGWD